MSTPAQPLEPAPLQGIGHVARANSTVSPYSYYATLYLRKNRNALDSHGVEIEYVLCLWL